jgi:hypothetical protein
MDEDGTNRCQSHKLKALYEEIERKDAEFALHISHLAKLFVSVSNSSNVNTALRAHQWVHDLADSALYLYNDTRWEGRVLMLQCALKMRESLPQLIGYAKMQQIGIDIPDFLEPSYFDRVQVYMECLSIVNSVSLLFQTRKFPAGH